MFLKDEKITALDIGIGTLYIANDEENRIKDFITKSQFKYSDIDKYYKTVNIYKFSKEFSSTHYVPFLEAYCHALGNNEYYEQVLRVITFLDKFLQPIIIIKFVI